MVPIVTYIIRRLLSVIPILLVVGIVVFMIAHLIPGDPAALILGSEATIDEIQALREDMGLNDPLVVQFVNWGKGALRGDLGDSLYFNKPVIEVFLSRMEPSVLLVIMAITISILIGIPLGIIAAINRNKIGDKIAMVLSLVGISTPAFWLGLMLIMLFGIIWPIFPAVGYVPIREGGLLKSIYYLTLPALALGLQRSAGIARMTRSSMLDVLNNDFIRTARAKGLSELKVIVKHTLKNAMIPVITQIGISVAHLCGGAVVTETIFNIPGVGQMAVAAIGRRDYAIIQAHVLLVACAFIIVNLIIDMLYSVFDPRIEYN